MGSPLKTEKYSIRVLVRKRRGSDPPAGDGEVMNCEEVPCQSRATKRASHNILNADMCRFTQAHLGPRISPSTGQKVLDHKAALSQIGPAKQSMNVTKGPSKTLRSLFHW